MDSLPDASVHFVSDALTECTCYFYGLQLNNLFSENPSSSIRLSDILPTIYSIFKIVSQQYESISYLGPLRKASARSYIYDEQVFDAGVNGENTTQLILQSLKRPIQTVCPPSDKGLWLEKCEKSTYQESLNRWLSYLGISPIRVEGNSEFIKLKISDDNIADVGFGVSQVLPIIAAGLSMKKDGTLLLEQPEIHLHPSMQMKIADFLLSLVFQGKSVVVETHSDHIINRVIRRIMEDESSYLSNNVALYYVSKADCESSVCQICFDKYRGIIDAPSDFFTQYSGEVSQIMSIGLRNIQKKTEG